MKLKRSGRRKWINAIDNKQAAEIYRIFKLHEIPNYRVEMKGVNVKNIRFANELVVADHLELRSKVRRFCRRNGITEREVRVAQGRLAAGRSVSPMSIIEPTTYR